MKMTAKWIIFSLMIMGGTFSAQAAEILKSPAKNAILIEASTGAVLLEKGSDISIPPASMSKLMTIYIAFEQLKEGTIALNDLVKIGGENWKQWRLKGSTMFLNAGEEVTIDELLKGVIVQSGNDACVFLAEATAGSVDLFVDWMNEKAGELGLENSTFANTNGWPHPDHRMSVRDIGILSNRIINDFPEYYHYFSIENYKYKTHSFYNRNPLLGRMDGIDGLKTGHTEEAGYGLSASAVRDGRRLVVVVAGLNSNRARSREAQRLLSMGFRNFSVYPLLKADQVVDQANVWLGNQDQVPLVIENDVTLSLSRQARRKMKVKVFQ